MKKLINIFCAVAAIAALASCAKEELSVNAVADGAKEPLIFSAGFENTKTRIDDNFKTTWDDDDYFYVLDKACASSPEEIEVASDYVDSNVVVFASESLTTSPYYCVYNYSKQPSLEKDSVLVVAVDSSVNGSWSYAQVAVAKSSSKLFSLKNISAVISYELEKDSDVQSVTFTPGGKGFVKEVAVNFENYYKPVLENRAYCKSIKVGTKTTGTKKYFAAFPDTLSGLTITIKYASAEEKVINIDGQIVLKQGVVLNLGKIEGRASKTYKVISNVGFADKTENEDNSISGNVDPSGNFTYAFYKGDGTSKPVFQSADNSVLLYQPSNGKTTGGYVEIKSVSGDKIAGVRIYTSSVISSTTVRTSIDGADLTEKVNVKKSSSYTLSGLAANNIKVYCCGSSSSYRLRITAVEVTYIPDARTSQTLSFPKSSYNATVGQPFTAPTLSGAKTTVTYSSSDADVATVNPSTGAVTLIAGGTCTITATADESATYKEGVASYTLNVAAVATNISEIKALATSSTETSFAANLTDAVVTFVGSLSSGYRQGAYLQDATGAIYVFIDTTTTRLYEKEKISGVVTGNTSLFNGVKEITSLDLSKATIETTDVLPLSTVTLSNLKSNYNQYEYCRIKLENIYVYDGVSSSSDRSGYISQNEDSLAIYSTFSNVSIKVGANADIIAYPSYNYDNKQLSICQQNDVTVNSYKGIITVESAKTVSIDSTISLNATVNSGATITYSSSNNSVATVDASGNVTGVAAGTAVITLNAASKGDYSSASATCTVTVEGNEVKTLTCDFEKDTTNFVFDRLKNLQTYSGVTAHGGSYFGSTDGKTTVSMSTKSKIATPKSINFFVSKTSSNTKSSLWIVEVSSDNNEWTTVKELDAAGTITKGNWTEYSVDLSSCSNVYVRVRYSGSTALRVIDDLTIKY